MESPGVAWVALALGAVFLGGGLALLDRLAQAPETACDPDQRLCTDGALQDGTLAMVAWAALGMAALMDVLFLGLTRGGTVLA